MRSNSFFASDSIRAEGDVTDSVEYPWPFRRSRKASSTSGWSSAIRMRGSRVSAPLLGSSAIVAMGRDSWPQTRGHIESESPKYGQVSFQRPRIIKPYHSESYKQFPASQARVLTSCGNTCREFGHTRLYVFRRPCYSYLNATIGSTRIARLAGT